MLCTQHTYFNERDFFDVFVDYHSHIGESTPYCWFRVRNGRKCVSRCPKLVFDRSLAFFVFRHWLQQVLWSPAKFKFEFAKQSKISIHNSSKTKLCVLFVKTIHSSNLKQQRFNKVQHIYSSTCGISISGISAVSLQEVQVNLLLNRIVKVQ